MKKLLFTTLIILITSVPVIFCSVYDIFINTYTKDESPDLAVPNDLFSGVTSTINVPEDFIITEVNLYLDISHDFSVEELQIQLTSPEGITVVISPPLLPVENKTLKKWYGPKSTEPVSGPGSFNDFVNKSAKGDWKLNVSDRVSGDTGTINYWDLVIAGYKLKIENITDGQTFSGDTAEISIKVSSDITKVEFYIDNVLKYTDESFPFSYLLDLTEMREGEYTLNVKAYSGATLKASSSVKIKVADTFYCVKAYPNPFAPGDGHTNITFEGSGVPYSKIKIYTLSGYFINMIEEKSGLDKLIYSPVVDSEGRELPRGIYLYSTENFLEKNIGKFTIIR